MQENRIKITWYGTASVRITAGSSQLLIDPFFPYPESKIKVQNNAYDNCRHILISHGHFDHISSIRKIVQPGTVVYCTAAPYRSLRRFGVRKENLHRITAGSVLKLGEFRVTALKGNHIQISILKGLFNRHVLHNRKGLLRKLLTIAVCPEKKESLCYLVEVSGKRILILGSLALAADTDYPTEADLAFFPYQGSEKLYEIAVGIYQKLRPKAVLLTHFDDTFPPFSAEIDTAEFEAYLKDRAAVYKLHQGSSLTL